MAFPYVRCLLTIEQEAKVRKAARRGFYPHELLGPLEEESSRLWTAAMNRAVPRNQDDCVFDYQPDDQRRMKELNRKIHEVMDCWEDEKVQIYRETHAQQRA
jgi:hypothetical protein